MVDVTANDVVINIAHRGNSPFQNMLG
jgi:hypothetical protein